jgi:hypothetical protein
METIDLDKYKASWKSEQSFENKPLSEADIQGFLKKRSGEISKLFRKGLIFDMVLKSVIGASFLVQILLFVETLKVIGMISFMLAGILAGILFQRSMLRKIPAFDYAKQSLREVLEGKIGFYKNDFVRSLYVGALSNPFLIISGMLYYFHFKYEGIRPLEWEDYIVFGLIIIISFVLGAFTQIKQHHFHIRQLEVCLKEIDEDTLTQLTLKKQRQRRRQLFFIYLLAIVCGLLVLAYILA